MAAVYVWPMDKRPIDGNGHHGSLHAKCAVADDAVLFVSSANLTAYALTLNMELGLLVQGGFAPLSSCSSYHTVDRDWCVGECEVVQVRIRILTAKPVHFACTVCTQSRRLWRWLTPPAATASHVEIALQSQVPALDLPIKRPQLALQAHALLLLAACRRQGSQNPHLDLAT